MTKHDKTYETFKKYIFEFSDHLKNNKNSSNNTLQAYERNLSKFCYFITERGIESFDEVDNKEIALYRQYLENDGFSASSVSQALSAIRSFYQYLISTSAVSVNPARQVHNAKPASVDLQILTTDEVDSLLSRPDGKDAKGLRDKAMLELIYATGVRVTELISLDIDDIDLTLEYLRCNKSGKERIIGLYPGIVKIISDYIEKSRPVMMNGGGEKALFLNISGGRMTRQGFWKILKGYAAEAKINKVITPHTLRHSLAAHLLENGADIKEVKELLGHSDISSTMRYTQCLKKKTDVGYISKYHPRA